MLTSSFALLGAYAGPWLLQMPPSENAVFKDSLAEPSSRALMLIGCGTLVAYGLIKRLRQDRKAASLATSYSGSKRRAA